MMQERDLQELAELRAEKTPVLSLYLNVGTQGHSADQYRLPLRQMLAQAAEQGAAAADVERIERFFEHEYNHTGRAVACFSYQAGDFWRAYPLLVPVDDCVSVGDRAYLKP